MTTSSGSELEHFKGCHPEDARAAEAPEGYQPSETEQCWHCGTPTRRGCSCRECLDSDDDVPADMIYHCPVCGRWWSYMWLRIIEMVFDPTGKSGEGK